jgi:hypothetical protein
MINKKFLLLIVIFQIFLILWAIQNILPYFGCFQSPLLCPVSYIGFPIPSFITKLLWPEKDLGFITFPLIGFPFGELIVSIIVIILAFKSFKKIYKLKKVNSKLVIIQFLLFLFSTIFIHTTIPYE